MVFVHDTILVSTKKSSRTFIFGLAVGLVAVGDMSYCLILLDSLFVYNRVDTKGKNSSSIQICQVL